MFRFFAVILAALPLCIDFGGAQQTTAASRRRHCTNPPYVSCGVCATDPWPTERSPIRTIKTIPMQRPGISRASVMTFEVGDIVYYRAKNGNFTLTGSVNVTCQADGTWSKPPGCKREYFCQLPVVQNAQCSGGANNQVRLNQIASCSCSTGYTLVGSGDIVCKRGNVWTELYADDNGRWLHPSCQLATTTTTGRPPGCYNGAPVVRNGVCSKVGSGTVYLVGETARCSCNTGYGISSTVSPTCMGRGRFSNVPTCTANSDVRNCSTPPLVPGAGCDGCEGYNNRTRKTSFKPGDSATYQCGPGYFMVGNPVVTCLNTGIWSRAPTCNTGSTTPKGVRCQGVPSIANGRCVAVDEEFDDNEDEDLEFQVGSELACTCGITSDLVNDYKLVGNSAVVCLASGQWSRRPTCQSNRRSTTPSVTEAPTCETPRIMNGFCSLQGDEATSQTTYDVGQKVKCQCNDGFYRPALDRKVSVRRRTTTTTRAPRDLRTTRRRSSATRSSSGRSLLGSALLELTCNQSGVWSTDPSAYNCVPKSRCGDEPELANGFCQPESFDISEVGDFASCQCYDGFQFSGGNSSVTIRCADSGNWAQPPNCQRLPSTTTPANARRVCNNNPVIDNGSCNRAGGNVSTSGQEVACSCSSSYRFEDEAVSTAVCRGSDRWNLPTCVRIDGSLDIQLRLFEAAKNAQVDVVRNILQQYGRSIDVNWRYPNETMGTVNATALIIAAKSCLNFSGAQYGDEVMETMKLLLDHGANVTLNETGKLGAAALYFAAESCDMPQGPAIVKLLLDRGANLSQRLASRSASTAYGAACFAQRTETIELLLDRNPSLINQRDGLCGQIDFCGTCLLHAVATTVTPRINQTVGMLLKRGSSHSMGDYWRHTPMQRALHSYKTVAFLVEQGVSTEHADHASHTALMWAAMNNNQVQFWYLVSVGANYLRCPQYALCNQARNFTVVSASCSGFVLAPK